MILNNAGNPERCFENKKRHSYEWRFLFSLQKKLIFG